MFITAEPANPASAKFLFRLDGVAADVSDFTRVFDLFDGNNEQAVTDARKRWSDAKTAGHAITYWKQGDAGWVKAG